MGTKQTVILAGGTGTLGKALADSLVAKGFEVIALTRNIKPDFSHPQVLWDGNRVEDHWGKLLKNNIVINLAGELVDRVPSKRNIDLLTSSRVNPTKALVEASQKHGAASLWIQMSTAARYGDAGTKEITEELGLAIQDSTAGWLPQMNGVATAWEKAAAEANAKRICVLRAGVVLAKDTPAFNRLRTMVKLGLGGTIGKGGQFVSWIHEADFIAAVLFLIENPGQSGMFHVASPAPVTNAELMSALRTSLGKGWAPGTPVWLVKLGARLLFRTDPALAIYGRRVIPHRLISAGFVYSFPTLAGALGDLTKP